MSKKIGVLGCGWLGLPLAKKLLEDSYQVFGTTTSPGKLELLKDAGIIPYLVSLSDIEVHGDMEGFLSNVEVLIINVPPRLRGSNTENFVEKMKLLLNAIKKSPVSKVLFISSTSVYGEIEGEVTEETSPEPATESGIQLLASEKLFKSAAFVETAIIRFGGLIGPERHPVTMLSGRQGLSNGEDPINLIHLDDCIHLISTILHQAYWDETFNGVYPLHPKKKDYYTSEAKKRNIIPPTYKNEVSEKRGKTVISRIFLDRSHNFKTSIES